MPKNRILYDFVSETLKGRTEAWMHINGRNEETVSRVLNGERRPDGWVKLKKRGYDSVARR